MRLAAIGRGDSEALLALVADDIEWIIPSEAWPLAATHRGYAGMLALLATASQSPDTSTEPREHLAQEDRVMVVGVATGIVKATNTASADDWVFAITVSGGKLTRIREYVDTQALASASEADTRVTSAPSGAALPGSGFCGKAMPREREGAGQALADVMIDAAIKLDLCRIPQLHVERDACRSAFQIAAVDRVSARLLQVDADAEPAVLAEAVAHVGMLDERRLRGVTERDGVQRRSRRALDDIVEGAGRIGRAVKGAREAVDDLDPLELFDRITGRGGDVQLVDPRVLHDARLHAADCGPCTERM